MRKSLLIVTVGMLGLATLVVKSTFATSGCRGRSPASMAGLTNNGEPLDRVPAPPPEKVANKPVVTSESSMADKPGAPPADDSAKAAEGACASFDKPYRGYVVDANAEKTGFLAVEKVTW